MPKPKQAKPAKADEPFDDKQARFIEIIADNGTLDDVARELKVHRTTPLRWLREDDTGELRNQYARARDDQGDLSADEVKDVARRVARGEIEPSAGKVLIDALKWDAGKRKPKVYGDRVQLDQTVTVKPADQMDDNELAAIALGSGAGIAAPSRGSA
jgi:hypothetical protein